MCRSICSQTEKVTTFETLNETRSMRPAVSAAHLPLPATGYGDQRAKRPPIRKRTLIEAQTTDRIHDNLKRAERVAQASALGSPRAAMPAGDRW